MLNQVVSKTLTRPETWIGYKLHIDVADGQIPISCILTSASLHDSPSRHSARDGVRRAHDQPGMT